MDILTGNALGWGQILSRVGPLRDKFVFNFLLMFALCLLFYLIPKMNRPKDKVFDQKGEGWDKNEVEIQRIAHTILNTQKKKRSFVFHLLIAIAKHKFI